MSAEFPDYLFSHLPLPLREELKQHASLLSVEANTEILRENQYIKVLPIVVSGLIKVYSRFQEKELLLYYIEPAQSCVMTFYAGLNNTPSQIFAITETQAELLVIPSHLLTRWVNEYPEFNTLFYNQYNLRYAELLETIGHLILDKLDKRLYDHLLKRWELTGKQAIKMSHQQLATELGTSREVITRVLKKLETEGKVSQEKTGIQIQSPW